MARSVCMSQHAFVGVITTATARYLPEPDPYDKIVSDLHFEVERTLYGDPLSTVTLTVPGGELDGRVVVGPSSLPQPKPGTRYMVSYSLLKQTVGISLEGDPIITATFWISPPTELPASELPPEQELRSELDAFCQEQGLPRYHDLMGG
jgi:hypothetical protein